MYSGLDMLNIKLIESVWSNECRWTLKEPDAEDIQGRLAGIVSKWMW